MNQKQVRLTESDLKQIVKESVNRLLQEKRIGYDSVMKDEMANSFNELEETAQVLVAMLVGYKMNSFGSDLPGYAKQFGYTKSYKRLANALNYAKKAKELINAAKQDMLGEYGNIEEPKYQPHDHLSYEGGQDY